MIKNLLKRAKIQHNYELQITNYKLFTKKLLQNKFAGVFLSLAYCRISILAYCSSFVIEEILPYFKASAKRV
jgi:hypothetical protein